MLWKRLLVVTCILFISTFNITGNTMENLLKEPIHPGTITEVDMFSKKTTTKPATDYPESIQFMEYSPIADNSITKLVPITEIHVHSLNSEGELDYKKNAKGALIEYLDANKNVIKSTRMVSPKR